MQRLLKGALVLGAALALPLPAAVAATTAKPAGGTVHVFVTPGNGRGPITLTGAIGDFGRFVTVTKAGAPSPNGNFVRITLRQGGFEVDSTTLNEKVDHTTPAFNMATCSGQLVVTGPVGLFGGTGRYAGISGTITITETFGFVAPRYASGPHKGQCNGGANVAPLSSWGSITGAGKVAFR